MLTLKVKVRLEKGKKVKNLRKKGVLPAVLYGPKIKNLSLEFNLKEFEKLYQEAGESSLVSLEMESSNDKFLVLIHEVAKDPITGEFIHVDFFQPDLTKEVEAVVPIMFEGESLAVKDLGGTLIKEIQEIEVKALPQNLPHEIKVSINKLKTFEDEILVKDLEIPENVKAQKEPEEIVAVITPPEKEEEEKSVKTEEEEKKVESEESAKAEEKVKEENKE